MVERPNIFLLTIEKVLLTPLFPSNRKHRIKAQQIQKYGRVHQGRYFHSNPLLTDAKIFRRG
jgi:hypothetical protein